MLKPLSYPDILLNLPVDKTLRTFLERAQLPLADAFEWTDTAETTKALTLAIQSCAQMDIRDNISAGLHTSALLSGPAGRLALFQAARSDISVHTGLALCQSDMHRSFWMFVHHPKLFAQASDIEYADQHIPQAQQHDLGVQVPVRRDPASLLALAAAVQSFYQKELGCGDVCIPTLLDRSGGTQLLIVHVKDLATVSLDFVGPELRRRVGTPVIHMLLEYSDATGVARTVIKGGAKHQQMLVDAFSVHMLGVDVNAKRIKPPTLDLTALGLGFQVPKAIEDGFVSVQVKSLTLMSPDQALKGEFMAMASSEQRCVTELMGKHLESNNPLTRGWEIQAARINLYYPPCPGRVRGKLVAVEVTRHGRLNLHKFDEQLRAQLEGYLISLGVMRPEQRLSPQEVPEEEVLEVAFE